jgi:hypothetical protein
VSVWLVVGGLTALLLIVVGLVEVSRLSDSRIDTGWKKCDACRSGSVLLLPDWISSPLCRRHQRIKWRIDRLERDMDAHDYANRFQLRPPPGPGGPSS